MEILKFLATFKIKIYFFPQKHFMMAFRNTENTVIVGMKLQQSNWARI